MTPHLHILLVGGPMYEPLYASLPAFSDATGIQLSIEKSIDHPDLNRRIERNLTSGASQYDLISTHTKYAPGHARWLTDLPEFEDQLEDFEARTIGLARIGTGLKSIPRNLDLKLLYHRHDLVPKPPKSWAELKEVALQQSRNGTYGFVFPGKESGLFGHFYELQAMFGQDLFAGSDNQQLQVHANNPAGHHALGLLCDLLEAAPAATPDWHYDEVSRCFCDGHAAMTTDWPGGFYQYNQPRSKVKGKYSLALYPSGPAGRQIYAGSHSFAIPTTVKNRPAALQLLRHLTNTASQLLEARQGSLPTRKSALKAIQDECLPGSFEAARWQLLGEASQHALIPPKHALYPACEEIVWRNLQKALRREIEIEAALERIERQILEVKA